MSKRSLLLLVLAACGGAPAMPAAPIVHRAVVAPPPPAQVVARYRYRNVAGWFDLAIDGVDEKARTTCETLLRRGVETPLLEGHPGEVVRACGIEPLPAIPPGVHLVDRRGLREFERLDFLLDETLSRSGTVTQHTPSASASACERARAQLDDEIEQTRERVRAAAASFNAALLREAQAKERQSCDRAAQTRTKPCEPCSDRDSCSFEKVRCETDRSEAARDCEEQRERVRWLRDRPSDPGPGADVRCVAG
jgi:hypothetical protein